MSEKLIPIGRLVNVHATRGELRLFPYNPDSATLKPGAEVVLQRGDETRHERLTAIRSHHKFLLITLAGCSSMTAAEALVGSEVCVPETALPHVADNEVYHYQLVGMQVVTVQGELVGLVHEVMPLPSADICVVHGADRKEYLIPMVAQIIKSIDHANRRLVIDPIPGLLDV